MIPEHCYTKVKKETKEIQDKIQEKLGLNPIENDVVVLYEGEKLPDEVNIMSHKKVIKKSKVD